MYAGFTGACEKERNPIPLQKEIGFSSYVTSWCCANWIQSFSEGEILSFTWIFPIFYIFHINVQWVSCVNAEVHIDKNLPSWIYVLTPLCVSLSLHISLHSWKMNQTTVCQKQISLWQRKDWLSHYVTFWHFLIK